MDFFCGKNQHPARLSDTERVVFETYRDRQLDAPFIDREPSSLLDCMNALLDADKAQQCRCQCQGKELYEVIMHQGQKMFVPFVPVN